MAIPPGDLCQRLGRNGVSFTRNCYSENLKCDACESCYKGGRILRIEHSPDQYQRAGMAVVEFGKGLRQHAPGRWIVPAV